MKGQARDAAEAAKLIGTLSDVRFRNREAATKALKSIGAIVLPYLERALEEESELETRTRLKNIRKVILEKELRPTGPALRQIRAVGALERIGTRAAREHLATLARGEPRARLTREAAAALVRLAVIPTPSR